MKKSLFNPLRNFLAIAFVLMCSNALFGQNVTVSGAAVGNGTYPDLNSAFTAINGGSQTGQTITVSIVGNTTETLTAVLNPGTWTKLTVVPSGGAARTITGALAAPLVDLNGATNVVIDGLNSGGNALEISNTDVGNALTSTIRLIGGASNNTITNASILGSSTSATLGTIYCYTTSTTGNNDNLISDCNIGPAGANLPVNAILSMGTTSNDNTNNTIQNCNIFDFFSAGVATNGIFISTNSTAWTITGNRIYQTSTRTYTTANTHTGIRIAVGNNHTVSNNKIGYASSTGTGFYSMGGTVASLFVGINLAVGTATASSVLGNTVAAITLTTSSTAATANGVIAGINVTSGNASISNNLIGGTSGVDLIFSNQTTTGGAVVGINASSTGAITISNNYIGGLTSTGTTAAITGGVMGINISGASALLSVTGNTIGNTTPDNMRAGTLGLTTGNSVMVGINFAAAAVGVANISGNTLQNFASYGTGTGGTLKGMFTTSTAGSTTYSITNNTLTNFVSNNANVAVANGQIGNGGIIISNGVSNRIMYNTISGLTNTTTATTAVNVGAIATGVSSDPVIAFNRISNINNVGLSVSLTAPTMVFGIFVRGSGGDCNIFNNMITLGDGQTSNTSFAGVTLFGGGGAPVMTRMYFNTINIMGTVTSGGAHSAAFLRGSFAGSVTFPVDVRNNIFTNMRTGGTGSHYAIANAITGTSSITGWAVTAANYNVLNAANPSTIGYWTSAQNFAGWKTASGGDANSYSGITVTYVNPASDLHLNMGTTPTLIESGAQLITGLVNTLVVNGITTDNDSQTRPGPSSPLNGGSFAPDIGADEFDGKFLDVAGPAITHTALPGSCATGDRTLSANIIDPSGVPGSGTLTPRIYFNKNAGAYVSAPGILAAGTNSNGTWNFTISATALSGVTFSDVISYFIIAQDGSATNNIISSPSLGLVATDVNSVTTSPSTTYSYLVSSLSGTYTIGAAGNFTSITSAANMYNASCLAGSVTYMLTDALYSTSETFPITFSNNAYASATNSLLIRPASANTATITGSFSTAIIGFSGADFVKVDGSNNGSTSRDLTVENTGTVATTVAFFIGNSSLTNAASNIAINNCIITGSTGVTTVAGVIIGSGVTFGGASDIPNNDITVSGNLCTRFQQFVFASGNATTPDANWVFTNNMCGSSNVSDKLGFRGILVQNANNVVISSNTIAGVSNTVASNTGMGISAGSNAANYTITNNYVYDLKNMNATTTAGMHGIRLTSSSTAANFLVANNMVSDIATRGSTTAGAANNGYGITILSGAGYKIYHNSILLNTDQVVTGVQAPLFVSSGVTAVGAIDLRNNIIANTQTLGTERYAIYSQQTSNTIFSNIDFNSYSTTGPNLGFIGSARATLANVQTGFGSNLNSNTVAPVFVGANDLHLVPASNPGLDDLGTPGLGVTTDIDNQSRSVTLPDMGADEFTGPGCVAVTAQSLSIAGYSICTGNQSVTISGAGGSSGSGFVQQWKVSSAAGGPYTNVATGSGFTSANYNTGTLTPGPLYYVLTTTCTTASLTATSNEATVTVFAYPTTTIATTHTLSCQGNTVTLTASGATTYSWSATAGAATTTAVDVVPTAATLYSVTGTSNGCSLSASVNILYSANPVITAASTPTYICLNTQGTLTAFGANTYTWTDGTNSFNGATVNPSPTVATTYSIVGTNTAGCVSAQITKAISVNFPTVTISGNTALCPGQSTTLTASGAVSYSWNTTATTNTISSSPPSNTVYVVTGTDAQGCKSTINQSVTVGSVSITITGASTVCDGSAVNLTANGGVSYTWSEGSQTSTIAPSPTVNTTYSVVGASGICSNSAQITVTVNPLPSVSISASGSPTICAAQTISLTGNGALTYTWSTTSTNTTIAVSPTASTNYTVTGKNSFGCTAPATIDVVANPLPTISIVASATAVCLTSPASFTASGANTYTWNTTGPVSAVFSATPTANTTYTVAGTNTNNCTNSKTVSIVTNTLPVVAITPASATVCVDNTLTLNASGATTYTWDGTTSGASITFTPLTSGNHTLVGTNAAGCTSSATMAVTANPNPTVTISPATLTVCSLSASNFTASGASTYTWDASITGSTAVFFQANSITHTVLGVSALGCFGTASVLVTTNPLPTVSISPSLTTMCAFSTANFTASGASTYLWFNTSTTAVVAITPTALGSYSVVGTDQNGCSSNAQAIVITNSLPIVSVNPSTGTVCPSTTIALTASGAGTYVWANSVGTSSSVVVSPSVATVYTVNGTDVNTGCVGTKTVSISTYTNPVITISPASPSICLNDEVTLTASGAGSYTWSAASNDPTVSVSPSATSNYSVSGKNSSGCVSSKSVTVTVNPLPVVSVAPGLKDTICLGESASFTVSGGTTYTWTPGGSNSATFSFTPTATSFYTVGATDSKGCQNTALVILSVNPCTGLKENAASNDFLSVYPNPSSGLFNIDLYSDASVMVYDMLGSVIYSEKLQSGKQAIDLKEKAKGVYFMKVMVGSKHQTLRLVVE